jgi:anti-sigma factor RsiW
MNRRDTMNSKQLDYDTLPDFLDGALSVEKRQEFEKAMQGDPALARETEELSQVLALLHQLPQREPVIDVWPELEPKLIQHQLEERMGLFARWRFRGVRFLSNFASGAILFTHAVALNTETKMRKYVMPGSLTSGGEG